MPAPRGRAGSPDSLVELLAAQAPRKPVNAMIGIQKYYASADLLLRQASSYRRSHNEEQLYVMLMRFASLMIETIPSHKDFSRASPDGKYQDLVKTLQKNIFPELEQIKLSLRTKEAPEPVARSSNRPSDLVKLSTSSLPQLNWAAVAPGGYPPPPPPPAFNVEDLLDFVTPGRTGSSPGPGAQPPPPPPQDRQLVPTSSLPDYQPKYTLQRAGDNNHTLFFSSAPLVARPSVPSSYSPSMPSSSAPVPRYPSLDHLLPSLQSSQPPPFPPPPGIDPMSMSDAQRAMMSMQIAPSAGPPLGPQEVEVYSMSPHLPPGPPGSCSDPHPAEPGPMPPDITTGPTPGGPKELAKRAALRDVHVSVALMEEFLRFAASNTSRGIETCGILAAQLSANDSVFTISTLIIPKQKGTSDTVEMMSEEDVLMVHLERELYPLGWIHTHPTQTCFLSSVDVHTQCSYQTMLDEAVAIVMAPSDRAKRCGIFRLTTPGGLSLVQKCDRRGFHMHPETSTGQELYELCGHVYLNDRVKHEVIDLR